MVVRLRPILLTLAVCLLAACIIHVSDIWRHGWLPYRFAPLPLNVYWTSLAFFDALAAFLLVVSPRIGLFLALLIITSDVSLNLFARFGLGLHLRPLALLLQIVFFVAVVTTIVCGQRTGAITRTI